MPGMGRQWQTKITTPVSHPPVPFNFISHLSRTTRWRNRNNFLFLLFSPLIGKAPDRLSKLSPPRSGTQNSFEKPIPIRGGSPKAPSARPSSNRPPSGGALRPKSSRRPPSRTVRDRLSVIHQDSSRPTTGQVPRVIVEGNTLSDDEEDRIVKAAVFDQTAADLTRSGAEELLGGEQGKLVEQILSAQREFDPHDTVKTFIFN